MLDSRISCVYIYLIGKFTFHSSGEDVEGGWGCKVNLSKIYMPQTLPPPRMFIAVKYIWRNVNLSAQKVPQ